MKYADIDDRKTAFIFELDDVLYPEKDYLLQVYYLFAGFMEYTELLDANVLVKLMAQTYHEEGHNQVFNAVQKKFKLDEKYRENFERLQLTADVPLKLLLFQNMLAFMQDIIVDRKNIFIVTNENPIKQLNKIKHTEWHGLEKYLTCYFAEEVAAMPEPDTIYLLMKEHKLHIRDIIMIGKTEASSYCAEACGIDYIPSAEILLA
jgi:phosphoglycolate phosphatase-like HAD superfamily hydrolase